MVWKPSGLHRCHSTRHGIPVLPSMVLIDVMAHVTWLPVVDDVVSDQCCLLASRGSGGRKPPSLGVPSRRAIPKLLLDA